MKVRTLSLAILLWAAVLGLTSQDMVAQQFPTLPVIPKEPAPDTAGVQPFLTAFVAAMNAHNADAFLRLQAEDNVTVNRVGLLFIGKKTQAPFIHWLLGEHFKDQQFPPFRILHEQSLTPDLVIVQVLWPQVETAMPQPWPKADDMIITFVLRKIGDGWLSEEVDSHDVWPPLKP
jgi:hypothetical protein